MPLEFQLRKYLESPLVLETILENLAPSQDGYIRSLVDGSVWQQRRANVKSNIVIPLNLFFDDFTTKDTVSPHASGTSILGIYYYVPCLPGYILAKLANILVAGFILSEDRKAFENEDLFGNLVQTLIDLEVNGLVITSNGARIVVHFMIGFITGDNLGIAGILDLVESARANYYCRMCKRNREQREQDTVEYEQSFRTIDGYDNDLQLNDVSNTGIHKNSVFNQIPSFHVALNVYFDLMHDLWEGVCAYGLSHCLNYFIRTKKLFTLEELNCRKNVFVFGNLNSSNIPNDIKDTNIIKSKVKMTANEIKTLITFFPLIVGTLIPKDDAVWIHFCNLLKICHILMSREIHPTMLDTLKSLVEVHHTQYQELFDDTLKPKHHNIVHYASFIKHSGTPRHQWTMRGEGKHRDAKQYSRVNNNNTNLCKSLSIKAGYKFAQNVYNNNFMSPQVDFSQSKILPSLCSDFHAFVTEKVHFLNNPIQFLNSFIKQGSTYSRGTIFYVIYCNIVNIFELDSIITDRNNNLMLVCRTVMCRCFDEHLQSFEVYKTQQPKLITNIAHHETHPINLHTVNENLYFRFCNFNIMDKSIESLFVNL